MHILEKYNCRYECNIFLTSTKKRCDLLKLLYISIIYTVDSYLIVELRCLILIEVELIITL